MKSVRLKKLISCVAFSFLLLAAVAKCADVLEYKRARIKYTPFYESETNFDVIFLGTSHVENHILPMEMWNDYGIASYNWGFSNCTPAENYYLIQDILKYTSPKVVVLDAYGIVEYEDSNNKKYRTEKIEQQHVQFDSFPIWSINKYRASRDVFDDYDGKNDFIWNFIKYHNRWTELGESDYNYSITTEKGSKFLTGLGKGSYVEVDETARREIESVCFSYYLKIIEYCEEQGIQVLCTYLPCGKYGDKQIIANSLGDILEEYPNCSYVNMMDPNLINLQTDVYSDKTHLNYSGASKVTALLGQYLKENYSLDDYSENQFWIEDYEAYYQFKKDTLTSQNKLINYLIQLRDDDFHAEALVYDKSLMDMERLMMLFENADIEPVYVDEESEYCASLRITDRFGNVADEVNFIYSDTEEKGMTTIVKTAQ